MMIKRRFAAAAAALCCLGTSLGASAQTSIQLQHDQVTGNHALDALGELGLAASAATYARDRGTLFFVGDDGPGRGRDHPYRPDRGQPGPRRRLMGTPAADNLLILRLDSRRLVEVDRSGQLLSSLDLSGLTTQAVEGLTISDKGVIYLVAEDSDTANSRLFALTSPEPEPGTVALMLVGLAAVARRGSTKAIPRTYAKADRGLATCG